MLVSNQCAGLCRYCFRKRVFIAPKDDYVTDVDAALDYIRDHKDVTNVLLTGGDPLMADTSRLEFAASLMWPPRRVYPVRCCA